MAKFLDEKTKEQLISLFSGLDKTVTLVRFSKNDCENCSIVKNLFDELVDLGPTLKLKSYNITENPEVMKQFNIKDAPAYIILNNEGEHIGATFYGVPAGHEFNTLITNITDLGRSKDFFDSAVIKDIKAIDKPVDIKIFVTASCPKCPAAAINVSRLAQLNKNITTSIYESQTFDDVAESYKVTGVPKIILNETKEIMGNQPIEDFIKDINAL